MTQDLEVVWSGNLAPGTGVALAKQTDEILTAAAIDRNGTLHIAWVSGTGTWQGPVPAGPSVLERSAFVVAGRREHWSKGDQPVWKRRTITSRATSAPISLARAFHRAGARRVMESASGIIAKANPAYITCHHSLGR